MATMIESGIDEGGNLTIIKGDTVDILATWKSGGVPVNLTGYTAKMEIRARHGAADPALLTLTHLDGITLGGALGTVRIQRSAAQTAAFTFAGGVYDLKLIAAADPPGTKTLLKGKVVVEPRVTT